MLYNLAKLLNLQLLLSASKRTLYQNFLITDIQQT